MAVEKLVRPNYMHERIFPEIYVNIYIRRNPQEESIGQCILDLYREDLHWKKRIMGWRLNSIENISRLLKLHNQAIQAEMAEKWKRARFYWNQTYDVFKKIHSKTWNDLADYLSEHGGQQKTYQGELLRALFTDQLFIDSHCAFFNGYMESDKNKERAFFHLNLIETLLPFSALIRTEHVTFIEPGLHACFHDYKNKKKWKKAQSVIERLVEHHPGKTIYQNKSAETVFEKSLDDLLDSHDEADHLKNAQTIKRGIGRLVKLKTQHPFNPTIYHYIGTLHYLRSIQLANGNMLSQALVDVEKALSYCPYLKDAEQTRMTFVDIMQQLQADMQKIMSELSRQGNATLNAQGLKLKSQADIGFSLVNAYKESDEPEKTAHGLRVAQAHHMWADIGLDEENGRDETTCLALMEGIEDILSSQPQSMDDLTCLCEKLASQDISMQGLDSAKIVSYLIERLVNPSWKKNEDTITKTPAHFPVLMTRRDDSVSDHEPLIDWFMGADGKRVRRQSGAAFILLLVICLIAGLEYTQWRHRNLDYTRIQSALEGNDYMELVNSAEDYFSNPVLATDKRETDVCNIYAEAFVRWFIELDERALNDPDVRNHILKYREINNHLIY